MIISDNMKTKPKDMCNNAQLLIRVTPSTRVRIELASKEQGISCAELLRRAINEYLDKNNLETKVTSKVFDILESPEYIAKLKEKMSE